MNFEAASWVIATAAAVVALAAWWETRKARQAAERSEKSAKASAEAAGRSADEAERLTQIESDRLRDEREARHDERAPTMQAKITIDAMEGKKGEYGLFGTVTLARDYRVQAEGWMGNTRIPISFPSPLRAHTPHRFYIEPWSKDQTKARTEKIQLRFWPPIPGVDEGDTWECPCGRPTGETLTGTGHWEVPLPITIPPLPFVAWI